MSNSISFVGRLGADAEEKEVGDSTVVEFNVAENVYMGKGKDAHTNWYRVGIWGKYGEALKDSLVKGKEVQIRGELVNRKYDKKDGGQGFSSEIRNAQVNFVGPKEGGENKPKQSTGDQPTGEMPF